MDFGAEIADRSYQEIPTGALRPRNDILGSAFELNDKLKFDIPFPYHTANPVTLQGKLVCSQIRVVVLTIYSPKGAIFRYNEGK